MKQKITINDIAEMCQVSKSSVSRYLNHGYVSQANKEKIEKAIEQTGFETNFFAKRLKMKHRYLIGILIQELHEDRTHRLLVGLQKVLNEHGYQFIIQIAHFDHASQLEQIQNLYQQGVDGFILDTMFFDEDYEKLLTKLDRPYVLLRGHETNSLSIDDQQAGMLLGDYMAKMGHHKLMYVMDSKNSGMDELRIQGIKDAYMSLAIDVDIESINVSDEQDTYSKGLQIISSLADAILVSKDALALGLLRCFHENHIEVPGDVSIAGFGGDNLADLMYPKLCSIAYDYQKQGEMGALQLLAAIEEKEWKQEEAFTFTIKEGESVRHI